MRKQRRRSASPLSRVFASIKGTFLKDSCNTKLRTYCKFKKTYTFENYLGVSVDKKIISQYSNLRLSSHRLNIEVGRYRTRPPVNLRTCNICSSSDIEDEFHLMCVCSKYSDIRNNLFEPISKFVVNFDTLSLLEKFLMILSSQQSDVNLLVVDYVNKCFEVRVMQFRSSNNCKNYRIQSIVYIIHSLLKHTSIGKSICISNIYWFHYI